MLKTPDKNPLIFTSKYKLDLSASSFVPSASLGFCF
ncbi:hypothetical protein SLEP1_g50703 [Rubroshorea leprosula]|uniref:Uncharacterized protein n=1 Tax=Rubroshorea leprosula TaxID=152421 RepID=A0AAV5M1T2_9ROSI|nr:hypothetical protein SLEP1_g50703 [Rubroshorea leprosula]